jgi:hypothetical protein
MFKPFVVAFILSVMTASVGAMGPDPGGKTGQGVTSESTRTAHPQGDKTTRGDESKDPRGDNRAETSGEGQKDQRR